MVNDILDKVLDMIKETTGIDKFDNTEFLIEFLINYQTILL